MTGCGWRQLTGSLGCQVSGAAFASVVGLDQHRREDRSRQTIGSRPTVLPTVDGCPPDSRPRGELEPFR